MINKLENRILQVTIRKELYSAVDDLCRLLSQRGYKITKSMLVTNALYNYIQVLHDQEEQIKEYEKEEENNA